MIPNPDYQRNSNYSRVVQGVVVLLKMKNLMKMVLSREMELVWQRQLEASVQVLVLLWVLELVSLLQQELVVYHHLHQLQLVSFSFC